MQTKVLFFVPYPLRCAPSQRFRVELYLPELEKAGIRYSVHSFMDKRTWNIIYKNGYSLGKVWGLLKGFTRRWVSVLFYAPFYSHIFVHREAAPLGPPVFEWLLARVLKKKMIYDFDDAIWISDGKPASLITWLKSYWKVKFICKWSWRVVGGNNYLCDFARQINQNVILIPTSVDINNNTSEKMRRDNRRFYAGWTGSHSTLKYLDLVAPVIRDLQEKMDFGFIVIADKRPELKLKDWQFINWNVETESEDLSRLDIGLMPLSADAWSEGKCGFKLIQYYSAGIPAIASPVGVNKEIIENGKNGFLCDTYEDWQNALNSLLTNSSLREQMGVAGRKKVEEKYSIQAHVQTFLGLFS